MKYSFLHIVLFTCLSVWLLSYNLNAQVVDDFSDGNLGQNPAWIGDTTSFIVNASDQLQLAGSGAGKAYLSTPSSYLNNTQWEFWLKLDFSPSSNNYIKIYLASNQTDLFSSLNGYFVRIGENGSNDGLDLYRQNGLTVTKIIDGQTANLSLKPELKVKVIHESNGNWLLYSDVGASGNYVNEGSTVDNSLQAASFFGLTCTFTTTNAKAFYFDDLKTDLYEKDSLPPQLLSVKLLNDSSVQLNFNENLDKNLCENTANYLLLPGSKQPASVVQISGNEVKLSFNQTFENGRHYQIHVYNLADLSGNILLHDSLNFDFFLPGKGDVVINELMADPSPPVQLPEAEYIELLNVSGSDISLSGWELSDIINTVLLPDTTLKAGEYIILCNTRDAADLATYGRVIPVDLPSLNNSGDQISITSSNNSLIDEVTYAPSWYKDAAKSSGGWSLERINPFNPCGGRDNWQASNNPDGGTPGSVNSVYSVVLDTLPPVVSHYTFAGSHNIILTFNEQIDSSLVVPAHFRFLCQQYISKIAIQNLDEISLEIQPGFSDRDTCTLQFRELADCWGNKDTAWQSLTVQYIEPGLAGIYEVVINEIMADPDPPMQLPAVEYIELFNRSSKYFQLSNWRLSDPSTTTLLPSCLLPPGGYIILCDEKYTDDFKSFGTVLGVKNFPALGNSGDELWLEDDSGNPVFYLKYSDSWYQNDLKKQGGWSLEMKDPDNSCEGEPNWTASEDASGGTPGRQNSVNAINPDLADPEVEAVNCPDSFHLAILFSEKMDSISMADISHYIFSSNSPLLTSVKTNYPYYSEIQLTFKTVLTKGEIYSLRISGVTDCAGNLVADNEIKFGLPETVDSFDIVINEVLFNPWPGGEDFVELYNRSGKICDLKSMVLANFDEKGNVAQAKEISGFGYLLLPGEYCILTTAAKQLSSFYDVKYLQKVVEISSLPSFNDEEGHVVLLRHDNQTIDYFHYKKEYHSLLVKDVEGVSLERLSPNEATNDPVNWFSAASDAGFATPTYKNSQYSEIPFEDNTITLSPDIFTPDFDGHDDQLVIAYKLNKTGYHGSLKIYNTEGRLVKNISDHFLTGRQGFMTWDGSTDEGNRAPMGVYIILIKLHHTDGETRIYKKATTLYLRN